MSNRQKLPKPKAARAAPARPRAHDLTLKQVRQAMYRNERRGLVKRGYKDGSREGWWRYNGVEVPLFAVQVNAWRHTAAGLLKARVPREWRSRAGDIAEGRSVVVIEDPVAQLSGVALVRRAVARTGVLYLVPEWGVAAAEPRTPSAARADASSRPEPCPSCGAVQGRDCVTSAGRRAVWPHRPRDPQLVPEHFKDGS